MCKQYTLFHCKFSLAVIKQLKIMKSVLSELVFDHEMVDKLKKANLREEYMYNLLFSGKITLQEFLDVNRNAQY